MVKNNTQETWYTLDAREVMSRLETSEEGLSGEEARVRLEQHGPNSIRTEQKISPWKVLLNQFTSPLIYVLLVALVVTLLLARWGDVTVIAIVLIVNATLGFIQEFRAEKAVQSLMEMVSPRAKVRRDDHAQQVEGEDLVPGDIVLISEGDMVPVDLRLVKATALQVNESALTGESVPATKTAEALPKEKNLPPADQGNMAFMGTAVTSGHAEGVVVATGHQTELGEIAQGVREAGDIKTPLQRRMDQLAHWIAGAILIIAAVAFGVGLLMNRDIEQMFLLAVALAVAAIPAGLPVVLTVALAIGVRRMARRHAVIRHLPAVETLGSTTTIISDKTGTLTQNRMTVKGIHAGGTRYQVGGEALSAQGEIARDGEAVYLDQHAPLYYTLLAGLLNNGAELQGQNEEQSDGEAPLEPGGDPMEVALLVSARKGGLARAELLNRYPQMDEVPFKTERRFSATIHNVPEGEEGPLVLIKGAPEVLLDMCVNRLTPDGGEADLDHSALLQQNDELASEGLRVLAMAIGRGEEAARSIKEKHPAGMTFVGMQGLLDPPRPEAIEAVDCCHEAGIRVVMVTGDHARTAAAIAHQVHLDRAVGTSPTGVQEKGAETSNGNLPAVRTGQELAEISDEELKGVLDTVNVYARAKPDQKLRLVNRLKEKGQIVAVTGDGVNDAPALKAAHLGAAMGQTGTDVAKEASDMVITDDNFASVYSAVEEGRTAFRNIRMATFFLLSTGGADILIILTALAVGWPLPLLPAQILWCNVVTNGIADVALGFESGERVLFRRPPRPPREGILDAVLLERLVLVGVWLAAGTLGVFYWVYQNYGGDSEFLARVAALTTLVLFQKVHVFNCRSEELSVFRKSLLANKVLFFGVLTSLVVHLAALYIPWTQQLLSFRPLPWSIWAVILPVAASAIIVNELHKCLRPRDSEGAWERFWPRDG